MNEKSTVVAFCMQLKPGHEAEYQRRHAALWPDLSEALRRAGILEYHIFHDTVTNALFAFQRLADGADTAQLANLPVVRQWWAYMADLMLVNSDQSPVVQPCENVFTLLPHP